jgi:cytochrome c-type biogenesis protein
MSPSGSPLDFLWVFLAGVLVSFNPCIYPLLPITVAYIGANSADSRLKGFGLSLVYVSGVSLTYSILGLIAVLTGSIFGAFSQLPQVRMTAGLVIVFFGIALWKGEGFGLPVLKLPAAKKSGTYLSCFILGLFSGLVISPCVFPVLGSILIFVAAKKSFIYGGLLLFSFAFGMGLMLILAGTFSSILLNLPKSGRWMEIIKKACAAILIVAGIYFVISATTNFAQAQEAAIQPLACDFSLSSLSGNQVSLAEFKNKKSVVLFFWTTWCPYCLRQLRNLNRISDFASGDIEVLLVNVQESAARLKRFLYRNPTAFKVLLDSAADVARCYEVIGVPTIALINKRGELVFKDHYFPRAAYKRLLSD